MKTQSINFLKNTSMKTTFKSFITILAVIIFLASCKKDPMPIEKPSITDLEVGSSNNKTAYPGAELHIEAKILAPGNIASVKLEIHKVSGAGWEFEEVFRGTLVGKKNTEFHEHISVPADAALGIYHLHLSVTDQEGNTTEVESQLEVKVDPTLPTISNFEVEINAAGNDLHVESAIAATNKIAKVIVEVHGAGWEKEFVFTDAAMVGQTSYNFHKHLDISAAPKGHYHVHLKVVDQLNKENEAEEHFDKK